MSQSDLVLEFFGGADSGTASNMHIAQTDVGDRLLVGYGHAVYTMIAHDDRFSPVCFTGWRGASKSTNSHIAMIEPKAEVNIEARPGLSDVQGGKSLKYLGQLESNDKFYGGFHDRMDRRRDA